jgi:ATP-dependent RNA helicase DeaD
MQPDDMKGPAPLPGPDDWPVFDPPPSRPPSPPSSPGGDPQSPEGPPGSTAGIGESREERREPKEPEEPARPAPEVPEKAEDEEEKEPFGAGIIPKKSEEAAGPGSPASPKPQGTAPATGRPFEEFNLAPDVLEALRRTGIHRATPIQELVIGPILAGRDLMGKAETGTGKTVGFGAPIVGRIDTERVSVQALVLTPTRELAQQVAGVLEELGRGRGLGVALVVGGVHASEQVLKLRSRSQVVVGTPGRILDFLRDRTLSLVWCDVVVLDEADRMLDMGFIDDVSAIIDATPKERQTLLFSATIPHEVERLARRYMKEPEIFSTALGLSTVSEIQQYFEEVEFRDKLRALRKILDAHPDDTCIIFTNTRRQAIDLDRMLWGHGYPAGALHGDQEQDVRFRILESFRRREIKFLVATDVASRGLDIDDIARIINYEVPDEPEGYVHRIGRTGRASKSGIAITLVASKEWWDWQRIVKTTGFRIERMGKAPESRERRPERGRPEGGRGRDLGGRREGRGRGGQGHGSRREGDRGGGRGDRFRDRRRGDRGGAPAMQEGGVPRTDSSPPGSPERQSPREGGMGGPRREGEGEGCRRRGRRGGRGGRGGGSPGGGGGGPPPSGGPPPVEGAPD